LSFTFFFDDGAVRDSSLVISIVLKCCFLGEGFFPTIVSTDLTIFAESKAVGDGVIEALMALGGNAM